ncbi:MAG: hypothetical protein RIE58_08970 [Vicingaceae bacterium]
MLRSRKAQIERPIVIIGLDNSSSVRNLTDSLSLVNINQSLSELTTGLAEKFDVDIFQFGDEIVNINSAFDLDYSDQLTDVSSFLSEMENRYDNRNTAFLLLITDGNYNKGKNPIYSSSNFQYSVNCLAMGDTIVRRDAMIGKLEHNKIAYLGNSFEVSVQIKANLLRGESSRLLIKENDKIVAQKDLIFNKNEDVQIISFSLEALELGLRQYEITLEKVGDESSLGNNSKYIHVDIFEGKHKVLILASEPHPDVNALKLALNGSNNYSAIASTLKGFEGSAEAYSAIILVGVDPALAEKTNQIIKGKSVLFINTRRSNPAVFNKLKLGLEVKNFKGQYNEVTARLNEGFQFFAADEEVKNISTFPPLIVPMAEYNYVSQPFPFLFQTIGRVNTEYPLILFTEIDGVKQGFVAGEGLWRWRLHGFLKTKKHDLFDNMIIKFMQFLSIKEDRSRFRVTVEPAWFENQNVIFEAEYYDKSMELRNDLQVKLEIQDSEGKSFGYEFLKKGFQFYADLGQFEVGKFNWSATVDDGFAVLKKSGTFNVLPLQLEANDQTVNHDLLVNLATKHGGNMIYPDEIAAFGKKMSEADYKPSLHYKEKFMEIVSIKWLFFLLLFFASAEWGLRKYAGLT